MPDSLPDDETPQAPRAALWFYALPLIVIPAIVGAYGVLLTLGWIGHPATGERITLAFETCPEGQEVISARVVAMGLGDPVTTASPSGFQMTATFPEDELVAARIPETLVTPGHFQVVQNATVVVDFDEVQDATMRMDFTGEPSVAVQLTPSGADTLGSWMEAHPDEPITMLVDGTPHGDRPSRPANRNGRLTIQLHHNDRATQVERVAALALMMGMPLPCAATVHRVPSP